MAPKPKGISDDILKQIAKMYNTRASRELKQIAKRGISMGKSKFPKETPKPLPKPTRPLVVKPPRPKGVGKVAAVKPERPKYNRIPKGKKMAQTTSEQKAAESLANRRLRMAGDTPTKPKSAGTAKPVDVRGSVVKPPDKASMRPPRASKGSYEGDRLAGQARDDAASMGRGQKPPKRRKPPASGTPAKKPKVPKRPTGGASAAKPKSKGPKEPRAKRKPAEAGAFPPMTIRQQRTVKLQSDVDKIQERIANAKTPKQKANAELLLRNRILEAASKSRSGYGKYSGTRPLSDR